tara:strand:+ start:418 stop:879 length:462 start_codon:yes stop_codon:yes gene_type:complete
MNKNGSDKKRKKKKGKTTSSQGSQSEGGGLSTGFLIPSSTSSTTTSANGSTETSVLSLTVESQPPPSGSNVGPTDFTIETSAGEARFNVSLVPTTPGPGDINGQQRMTWKIEIQPEPKSNAEYRNVVHGLTQQLVQVCFLFSHCLLVLLFSIY